MSRPFSLSARLALILFAGLALAQLLTFGMVLAERSLVMRGLMVSYLSTDIASSVAMLDRLPGAERQAWLPRLERPNYRLLLGDPAAPETLGAQDDVWSVAGAVSKALGQPVLAGASPEPGGELRLVLRLKDGTPLAVDLAPPRLRLSPWMVVTLCVQLAVLAAVGWIAVRQATRPLGQLAAAARNLQPGQPAPPLPETGPLEVAQAAAAFNRMRQRIDSHLEERNQMIGAISHDLQTPITRMRLRADLLDDGTLRDKLQGDLSEMQHLVEQGLAYARSAQAEQEAVVPTDLVALVQSVVADHQDAQQDVVWKEAPSDEPTNCTVPTRPRALRRALGNLIDNAVKFAGAAEVRLEVSDGPPCIQVLDRGPGIPAHELGRVTQPFYRIEGSRNTSTGGTGLGLAIVQRLLPHCRAELRLAARAGGGLEASIRFSG